MISNGQPESVAHLLQPALSKALERLDGLDGWNAILHRDQRLVSTLPKVLACSDYAAGVLARYPQCLDELITSDRLHRPLELRELDPLFLQETPESETETQFIRRIRLFRHREQLCRFAVRRS